MLAARAWRYDPNAIQSGGLGNHELSNERLQFPDSRPSLLPCLNVQLWFFATTHSIPSSLSYAYLTRTPPFLIRRRLAFNDPFSSYLHFYFCGLVLLPLITCACPVQVTTEVFDTAFARLLVFKSYSSFLTDFSLFCVIPQTCFFGLFCFLASFSNLVVRSFTLPFLERLVF